MTLARPSGRRTAAISVSSAETSSRKRTSHEEFLPQYATSPRSGTGARGGTWSKEGVILYSPSQGSPLLRVSSNGGTPVAATKLTISTRAGVAGIGGHFFPWFLPDGRRFLYVSAGSSGPAARIFIGSLDGGEPIEVVQTRAPFPVAYAPEGYLLFTPEGLVAQAFDPGTGHLSGDVIRLSETPGGVFSTPGGVLAYVPFSISRGILVFGKVGGSFGAPELTWFDRAGKELARIGSHRAYRDPSISPDGKRVAGQINEDGRIR